MKKVTAGRDALGDFAPKFAELNDDVLFGEVWSREDNIIEKDKCCERNFSLMVLVFFYSSLDIVAKI